ncbi:hypothetical protein [Xanthobacter variabilis]|uniref:hypothetical protein n=1 Tax=Xanthobacter variabilis TaxID=3119932 RepID=UPI00374EB657
MTVWRLHLRPTVLDPGEVVAHCLEHKVLGLGWPGSNLLKIENEPAEQYLERHCDNIGYRERAVRAIMLNVAPGDFIWSRDQLGRYLLGKVTGRGYRRYGTGATDEERWIELQDLFHVVPAHIIGGDSGVDIADVDVPGAVKASFAGRGGAIQRIPDPFVGAYTPWLFKTKCGEAAELPPLGCFISALSSYELEDLVALFLQEQGWRVVLSSHARSTPRYECTLVRADGRTAGVQVKQIGWRVLDAALYAGDGQVDTVFLFAASGNYGEARPGNVTIIEKDALIAFARENHALLPRPISRWLDLEVERQVERQD